MPFGRKTHRRAICLSVITLTLCLSGCNRKVSDEALGTLERDRIVLRATASEIILEQPAREGYPVQQGEVLLQLDDSKQRAVVARAAAEVETARAYLEELRNGARQEEIASASARVSGAEATLIESEATHLRTLALLEQKLSAQAAVDTSRANRDAASAALDSAREDLLRLTNGTRPEQLAQSQARLEAADAQLALERHRLQELTVVATRNGLLDDLPWHPGDRVTQGVTVAVILADNLPFARVYVPEARRATLHPGDERQVHVDGIEQTLTGRLRWIASDPAFTPYYALNANDRSRLMYMAEFDLLDGDDLPTGIPVQVRLGDE